LLRYLARLPSVWLDVSWTSELTAMTQKEGLEEKIASAGVVVFVQKSCQYCDRLTALLSALDLTGGSFVEFDAPKGSALRKDLASRTGATSVPQLFVGGELVGGHDETRALVRKGSLGAMLHKAGAISEGSVARADGAAQAQVEAWPPTKIDWSKRSFCDAFLNGGNVPSVHGGGKKVVLISLGLASVVYLFAALFTPLDSAWRWCVMVPLLGGIGSGIQGMTNT
jgi:glutaredoxin 3